MGLTAEKEAKKRDAHSSQSRTRDLTRHAAKRGNVSEAGGDLATRVAVHPYLPRCREFEWWRSAPTNRDSLNQITQYGCPFVPRKLGVPFILRFPVTARDPLD